MKVKKSKNISKNIVETIIESNQTEIEHTTNTESMIKENLKLYKEPKQKTLLNYFLPSEPSNSIKKKPVNKENPKISKNETKSYQYCLDLGQKEIGSITCMVCSMKYTKIDKNDNKLHSKYHKIFLEGITLPKLKNEIEVDNWLSNNPREGKMVSLNYWMLKGKQLDKIKELFKIIGNETGDVDASANRINKSKLYLYLSPTRQILACIIAEPIKTSYPINPTPIKTALPSELKRNRAIVGIHRMWTKSEYRKKGICSKLLNCVLDTFCVSPIQKDYLAFYEPTELGILTAIKFFGNGNYGVLAYGDCDIANLN